MDCSKRRWAVWGNRLRRVSVILNPVLLVRVTIAISNDLSYSLSGSYPQKFVATKECHFQHADRVTNTKYNELLLGRILLETAQKAI